jgi:hypothetical protein
MNRPWNWTHNALRIRVARVRINHLGPQKAATQFCVELSREWESLGRDQILPGYEVFAESFGKRYAT